MDFFKGTTTRRTFSQCRKCVHKKSNQSPNILTLIEGLNITESNNKILVLANENMTTVNIICEESQYLREGGRGGVGTLHIIPLNMIDRGLG